MKRIKRILKQRTAASMVEVLVAFVVVMMMMAMFTKVITTSVSFLNRSRDTISQTEAFNANYYKTSEQEKRQAVTGEPLKLVGEGVEITLEKGQLKKYTDSQNGITRYSIDVEEDSQSGSE